MRKVFFMLLPMIFLIGMMEGCSIKNKDRSVVNEDAAMIKTEEVEKLTVEEKIALTENVIEPFPSEEEIARLKDVRNSNTTLSVPTDVEKIDGFYFIVDCYHNQVIYSDDLSAPLTQWHVMCDTMTRGHTVASDGIVYLIDDTENNKILVYQKEQDIFIHTQTINNVGKRPHYIRYEENTNSFYVLSSMTGEVYILKTKPNVSKNGDSRPVVSVLDIKTIKELSNTYCRSFSIEKDTIWFPASNGLIVKASFPECIVLKTYQAPREVGGLAQIYPIGNYYYLSVSTNAEGNQEDATLIRTSNLEALQNGQYEDLYDRLEPDRTSVGTPYHISTFDGYYYLVEHRHGHGLFEFSIQNDQMAEVKIVQ